MRILKLVLALNIPLGVANHSLRGLRPNAKELIEFAFENHVGDMRSEELLELMDFEFYTDYLRENCPGVPIHIETISNSPRLFLI
ncbi:MAG: hypothetical protein GY790_13590 [Bacteroidetes bacterium]|nr:hypothetical protein [Bacteroidota bacterium]